MLRVALTLLWNALRAPFFPLWLLARAVSRDRASWLRVGVRSHLVESPPPVPRLARWLPGLARRLPTSLDALRRFTDRVSRDPHVRGVWLEVPRLATGWSGAAELRRCVEGLRAGGKEVWVHLPEGGGHRELFVASAADRVVAGAGASFAPLGLTVAVPHLRDALDHVGLRFDVVARGEYKTAAERLVRQDMSDAQREQLGALLETHRARLEGALGARGGDAGGLLDRGIVDAGELVDAGFADAEGFVDDVLGDVMARSGGRRPGHGAAWLRRREARFFRRVVPRPYIAVVPLSGLIVEQEGGAGRTAVAFDPVAGLLRRLREDRRAVGVLLQIDSPGGSALTSERLHREIVRLGERKPVVAWMEDVAASGGYYLAVGAGHVVATETAVTGSIGVITAKLDASALLARVGVGVDTLRLHAHGDLFSPARGLDEAGRALLEGHVERLYRRFVDAVAGGRGMTPDEVDRLARGRVWSGRDAAARGLVDEVGGIGAALDALRARIDAPRAVRDRLEPRVVRPSSLGGGDPGPAPPGPAAALPGPVRDLVRLQASGARFLAWLPGVPDVP